MHSYQQQQQQQKEEEAEQQQQQLQRDQLLQLQKLQRPPGGLEGRRSGDEGSSSSSHESTTGGGLLLLQQQQCQNADETKKMSSSTVDSGLVLDDGSNATTASAEVNEGGPPRLLTPASSSLSMEDTFTEDEASTMMGLSKEKINRATTMEDHQDMSKHRLWSASVRGRSGLNLNCFQRNNAPPSAQFSQIKKWKRREGGSFTPPTVWQNVPRVHLISSLINPHEVTPRRAVLFLRST